MSVPVDPRSRRAGYEQHDARVRNLLLIGLGILAALVASGFAVTALIWYLDSQDQAYVSPLETRSQQPPEPRLEADPQAGGAQIIAAAQQRLAEYRWVDRDRGLAQIPVQRAMTILARRGWPDAQQHEMGAPSGETETYRKAPR